MKKTISSRGLRRILKKITAEKIKPKCKSRVPNVPNLVWAILLKGSKGSKKKNTGTPEKSVT